MPSTPPPRPVRGRPVRIKRENQEWQDAADGPGPTAEQESAVAAERIRRAARRTVDAEEAQERFRPPVVRSLADWRRNPPEPVSYIVDGVLARDAVTVLNGSYKTGKTSAAVDLTSCLADGTDWLGRYPVDFPDGTVCYWNIELGESTAFEWLDCRVVAGRSAARRIIPVNLRGLRVDLMAPIWQEWTLKTLTEHDVRAWIIDPLGRLLPDENSNRDTNLWWDALTYIIENSPVEAVLINAHPPHSDGEDRLPRSRGASAIMGDADNFLYWRHGGNPGDPPPDDYRYLSGFGRHIELPEVELSYDWDSRRYTAVGDGNRDRAERQRSRLADLAREALELALVNTDSSEVNAGTLFSYMHCAQKDKGPAATAAVREGLIVMREGTERGKPKWYSRG